MSLKTCSNGHLNKENIVHLVFLFLVKLFIDIFIKKEPYVGVYLSLTFFYIDRVQPRKSTLYTKIKRICQFFYYKENFKLFDCKLKNNQKKNFGDH